MYSYRAYGLAIASALPLPELEPHAGEPDVTIRFDTVYRSPSQEEALGTVRWYAAPHEIYLAYPDAGIILVRKGREIIFDPLPGTDERVLRMYILGAGLAIVLHQRELLVLHASAVRVGHDAVIFMGASGSGKSTTAGALHDAGHLLIADDIVPVEYRGSLPSVTAGFPQIKLWPEAARALGNDPDALQRVIPTAHKLARPTAGELPLKPLLLKRIYVLADGPDNFVSEHLSRQEACMELVRHTYVINILGTSDRVADNLRQCAELATKVPVHRLKRKRSFTDLRSLAHFVETDWRTD